MRMRGFSRAKTRVAAIRPNLDLQPAHKRSPTMAVRLWCIDVYAHMHVQYVQNQCMYMIVFILTTCGSVHGDEVQNALFARWALDITTVSICVPIVDC